MYVCDRNAEGLVDDEWCDDECDDLRAGFGVYACCGRGYCDIKCLECWADCWPYTSSRGGAVRGRGGWALPEPDADGERRRESLPVW